MDFSILIDEIESQKFSQDKIVLFLIEVNKSLVDIFSIVLFSIFLLARKPAPWAI